eukprot:15433071-Alexandrium_andersonii.AAC.1
MRVGSAPRPFGMGHVAPRHHLWAHVPERMESSALLRAPWWCPRAPLSRVSTWPQGGGVATQPPMVPQ